ncbi:MAG TPA: hypothetical protein VFZ34_04790 [Blastocatellia bacterium]|nr:hypothetical protein [Blastocatellia bacterium]
MKLKSRFLSLFLSLVVWLTAVATTADAQAPQAASAKPPESLSAAEFSRLSREISEEGGYFRSDNFTSNETSYLHVVDKMRELGATGGAYIGVGPEQNFTYIAKIRPRIAFIIDIRRQAIIQHLMYKAVFHLSPTRPQFFSRLLSKPLPKDRAPAADTPINELLAFFGRTPADEKAYAENLATIRKTIQDEFQFPLSDTDQKSLDYVYRHFRDEGLEIAYRVEGSWGNSSFPTLGEIIAQPDQNGKQGNFLASVEDYEFVRGMHRRNLIIPVVGDFGGPKAIASIGAYLKKIGVPVTAYYTSNVEQYLFSNNIFAAFANNIKKLPLTEKSLFIRAAVGRWGHPTQLPGHRLTTLIQYINVFLKDFDEGLYESYNDLTSLHYIEIKRP